jgi:NTE family protein
MGLTRRGVAFPSGLVAGQKLSFLLKSITRGSVAAPDFDSVPIPFRCVSTDIGTGEKVVHRDESLAELGVSEEDYRAYRERLRTRLPPPVVDSIQTVSAGVDTRQVTARLETLRNDLDRIYEMGVFETVDFRLVRDEGKNVLVIDAKPKSWGPTFLRIGAGFETNFEGDATLSLLATAHRMQLNSLGAEWRATLELGSAPGVRTELYQPLDYRGRFFVLGEAAYERYLVRVDVPGGPTREGGWSSPRAVCRPGPTSAPSARRGSAFFRGRGKAVVLIGRDPIPDIHFDLAGAFGRLSIDTLDSLNFPRRGTLAVGQVTSYSPSSEWTTT